MSDHSRDTDLEAALHPNPQTLVDSLRLWAWFGNGFDGELVPHLGLCALPQAGDTNDMMVAFSAFLGLNVYDLDNIYLMQDDTLCLRVTPERDCWLDLEGRQVAQLSGDFDDLDLLLSWSSAALRKGTVFLHVVFDALPADADVMAYFNSHLVSDTSVLASIPVRPMRGLREAYRLKRG